jgi:hypothetical protein
MPSDPWSLPGDPNYSYRYSYPSQGAVANEQDFPPLPDFSTFGFADDQPRPYDPVGTWGSYPVDAQYDEPGITDVGNDSFHQPVYFGADPGFSSYRPTYPVQGPPQFVQYPGEEPVWQDLLGPDFWESLNNEIGDGMYQPKPPGQLSAGDDGSLWVFDGRDWVPNNSSW